jgi:hypothetical protein
MTAAIYQCGDTIQITEIFYSFLGVPMDLPTYPTVTVYRADKTTTVTVTVTVLHMATGTYMAVLTLPNSEGIYYIQMNGTASDGTAVSHTEAFIVKFSSST